MALLPFLINELLDDQRRPVFGDIYDQKFGMGLYNDEIIKPRPSLLSVPLRSGYLRPWRTYDAKSSGVSTLESDSKHFMIHLDVPEFKLEELKVKVVDDYIVIDGKHGERSDQHGFVSRQFTRRYKIPDDVDKSAFVSIFSPKGVLGLLAPKMTEKTKESFEIPITCDTSNTSEKEIDKVEEKSKL